MAGALHFIGILGLAAITAVVVARGFARPTWKRGGVATLVLLGSLFVAVLGMHGCDAGAPLVQWAVPTACALAAVLFVGDGRVRAALAAGAFAVMIGSSLHYVDAVHGPSWVGNPRSMTLEGASAAPEWHTPVTRLWRRSPAEG